MPQSHILNHSFSNEPPNFNDCKVGELLLWVYNEKPRLYTKLFNGNIVEIGKGVESFIDLEDIDTTNLTEDSFFVYRNGKFVATNVIGSIDKISDIEITNPSNGEYLRYDALYESFRNFPIEYNLYELADVDVADPSDEEASNLQNNHVLIYNHSTNSFETTLRNNELATLEDVNYTQPDSEDNIPRILLYDNEESVWKNEYLDITKDPEPALGGHLNANNYSILNSSYRVVIVEANEAIVNINYNQGDYFIIKGVESTELESCIINVNAIPSKPNTSYALILEIRQKSGQILIGGLQNIHYEDGKPILLSGEGKTDIISILTNKTDEHETNEYDTYITAVALNLALSGQGGVAAYRYDKNRYPEIQSFDVASFYDDYFDYVELLLNFEEEVSTGYSWYEDKSNYNHPVVNTSTQLETNITTFGLTEYVAKFTTGTESITITPATPIELDSDFTLELFINYELNTYYKNTISVNHTYFSSDDLSITYSGQIVDNTESTTITVIVGSDTYSFSNGFRYFAYQNNRYVHIAVVRDSTDVFVYIDGYRASPISYVENNPVDILELDNIVCNLRGNLNSVRLTKGIVRYSSNFLVPDMRFGLLGGANDILESIVDDTYYLIGDIDIERNIFT